MPETAVDENDDAVSWKDQIRPTRQILSVQSVTKSEPVQRTAKNPFRPGIHIANLRHQYGALLLREYIAHRRIETTGTLVEQEYL